MPRSLIRLVDLGRHGCSDLLRWLWHRLPLSAGRRRYLRTRVVQAWPALFDNTNPGRRLQRRSDSIGSGTGSGIDFREGDVEKDGVKRQYVSALDALPLDVNPCRVMCFYLPQFHRIPENDAWWGEGFTEWANVKVAKRQFAGHYQPRMAGDLGYYDLLDASVLRRQIALARGYGIHGFCFYYYWFGGKRLLEKPIENYLQDRLLDLPFCLFWANENWTRRWDGLENEILIGQAHSPEDDLAFIEDVARHMRDPRYLRIRAKPLLIVYRPDLLPSPKDTARRWRNWCLANGIGEIYLAYTQSFESVNPSKYGFDAAIEFPPNNAVPPRMTRFVSPISSDFGSTVYDWDVFVKRSRRYKSPGYKVFRGVCPGWDNTARRKNRGTVFLNSSPRGYQEWLFNAIKATQRRFSDSDERLVFINAWNEWAEGAYLEPDHQYGYGYLEATRMALVRASLKPTALDTDRAKPVAIVIHTYYAEILDEILDYTRRIRSIPFKLYVSCPPEMTDHVQTRLAATGCDFFLLEAPNRGRDLLPFLKIVPLVAEAGHDLLIKVHTKKSPHRSDGHIWRRELFDRLLTNAALDQAIDTFRRDPGAGIVGPDEHVVSLERNIGSNGSNVRWLADRLGIDGSSLGKAKFVAGTMFFARVAALTPLMNIALKDDDFEEEHGQVDGTMAHALERAIGVSALSAGLTVRALSGLSESQKEYRFVQ